MSAPDAPADHSVELANIEAQKERDARAAEAAAQAQKEAKLRQLRTQAINGGRASSNQYFTSQGVDPRQYAGDIGQMIDSIAAGIAPDDPNPGGYFKDAGARAFTTAQDAERNRYMRSLDTLFPSNFDTSRIGDTLDDPILAAIDAEQRQSADAIIANMLSRGVITQTGYAGAEKELDRQEPGVRSRLAELGSTELAGGREKLRNIANSGRSAASANKLGTPFDPFSYGSQVDTAFNDWLQSLGQNIRGKVPGNLFSTDDIAAIAGRAQGAQNTNFSPNALAGILDDDQTDEDKKKRTDDNANSIF